MLACTSFSTFSRCSRCASRLFAADLFFEKFHVPHR
jgi:hypothetical protein